MEDAEFDAMLAAHEINPRTLFASDVDTFMRERLDRLATIIEHAMGKPVDES